MNGAILEITSHERDLGVWVATNLTWNRQVSERCSRARKLLGFVKRNTRHIQSTNVRRSIYLTIVRPHLGYAAQVWAPRSIYLISNLGKIQRRATKYFLKIPFSCCQSYEQRLKTLPLLYLLAIGMST